MAKETKSEQPPAQDDQQVPAGRTGTEIRRQPIVVRNEIALFDTGRFEHMWRVAQAMSGARLVPKHFQDKPGDCLLVVEQSIRWNMSPFAVAQKTFVIEGKLGYEAQLIAAVVNSSQIIERRLNHRYEGAGAKLVCIVTGRLTGEVLDREKRSPEIGTIKIKNSPLWTADPEQQLLYWTQRAWARAHCSDVLLGVYTPDELTGDVIEGEYQREPAPPAPQRNDFVQQGKTASPAAGAQVDKTASEETGEVSQGFAIILNDGSEVEAPDAKTYADWLLKEATRHVGDKALLDGLWESNSPTFGKLPPDVAEPLRAAWPAYKAKPETTKEGAQPALKV